MACLTETHATWARGDAVEILETSPVRVTPPCPVAGPGGCGGCDYQHASLEAQRAFKAQLLSEQLRRVAKIDLEVPVEAFADDGLHTRTRVRFGTTAEGHLGMRRRGSAEVLPVEGCLLASEAIEGLALERQSWPPGDDVQAVCVPGADAPVVALVAWEDDDQDVLLDGPGDLLDSDAGVQFAQINGRTFRVAAESFFQVHTRAAEVLTALVMDLLAPEEGHVVLDLYAGVGLFSLPIAEIVGPHGGVVAVESSSSAAEDARINLAAHPHAVVLEVPVNAGLLGELLEDADACVIDPPRAGVDAKSLNALCESDIRRLVMVSCNPATFARDLKVLLENGFSLVALRALDLFEMTEHVEIVALLTR